MQSIKIFVMLPKQTCQCYFVDSSVQKLPGVVREVSRAGLFELWGGCEGRYPGVWSVIGGAFMVG